MQTKRTRPAAMGTANVLMCATRGLNVRQNFFSSSRANVFSKVAAGPEPRFSSCCCTCCMCIWPEQIGYGKGLKQVDLRF